MSEFIYLILIYPIHATYLAHLILTHKITVMKYKLQSFPQCPVSFVLLRPSILLNTLSANTSICVPLLMRKIKSHTNYNLLNKTKRI
jgi:hypothetical protein